MRLADAATAYFLESSIMANLGVTKRGFTDYIQSIAAMGWQVRYAEVEGTVAGFIIYCVMSEYSQRKHMEIMNIYVVPEYRNRSIARMLIQDAIRVADKEDCVYSQISIGSLFKKNAEVINRLTANAFKKFGFEEVGVVMGRKGKRWRN